MVSTDEKMTKSCLTWFSHVKRRVINALMSKSELIQVEGIQKGRGMPKIIVVKIVIKDMSIKEVIESMNLDRIKCWKRLYCCGSIADTNNLEERLDCFCCCC